MSTSKGKFISFEGIDACGKSTQVKLLLAEMNKNSNCTVLVREPGGSTISEEIRQILLNDKLDDMSFRTEALLMTGSRAQLTNEKIYPTLSTGKNVIATNNLNPDVTFLLDLHPNEALNRRGNNNDRIEKAGLKLQMKVRNSYLEIAKLFDDRIVIIDGHQNQNAIHTEILNELNRRKIIS